MLSCSSRAGAVRGTGRDPCSTGRATSGSLWTRQQRIERRLSIPRHRDNGGGEPGGDLLGVRGRLDDPDERADAVVRLVQRPTCAPGALPTRVDEMMQFRDLADQLPLERVA